MCNDNETAIDYYNKALEIFEANKMILNISSVYISLAMIYSYKGELLKAKSALKKALSLDKSSTTICYVLRGSPKIYRSLLVPTFITNRERKRLVLYLEYRCNQINARGATDQRRADQPHTA